MGSCKPEYGKAALGVMYERTVMYPVVRLFTLLNCIISCLNFFCCLETLKKINVYCFKCECEKIFKILFSFVELSSRSLASTFLLQALVYKGYLGKKNPLKEVIAGCAEFLFSSKPFQRQFQRGKISKNRLQEDF